MVGASGAVSLCSFYVLRFVHTPGLVPVRVFLSSFLFRLMSDFALSSLSSFTLIISLSSVLLDYRTAALSNVSCAILVVLGLRTLPASCLSFVLG